MDQGLPRAAELLIERRRAPHDAGAATRLGPAPAEAGAVVVAVHGRALSPAYMIEHFVARLGAADDVAFILPVATGETWYPAGFLAPLVDNQPWLDGALAVMAAIEAELDDVDPERVLWSGFSQGGCLVAEHLARNPRRWGGAAILTGGMIGPPDIDLVVNGDFGGMPAYFSNGDPDDWVPLWRTRASADRYRDARAEVTMDVFPGRSHEIGDAEVTHARTMLERLG